MPRRVKRECVMKKGDSVESICDLPVGQDFMAGSRPGQSGLVTKFATTDSITASASMELAAKVPADGNLYRLSYESRLGMIESLKTQKDASEALIRDMELYGKEGAICIRGDGVIVAHVPSMGFITLDVPVSVDDSHAAAGCRVWHYKICSSSIRNIDCLSP